MPTVTDNKIRKTQKFQFSKFSSSQIQRKTYYKFSLRRKRKKKFNLNKRKSSTLHIWERCQRKRAARTHTTTVPPRSFPNTNPISWLLVFLSFPALPTARLKYFECGAITKQIFGKDLESQERLQVLYVVWSLVSWFESGPYSPLTNSIMRYFPYELGCWRGFSVCVCSVIEHRDRSTKMGNGIEFRAQSSCCGNDDQISNNTTNTDAPTSGREQCFQPMAADDLFLFQILFVCSVIYLNFISFNGRRVHCFLLAGFAVNSLMLRIEDR